MRIVRTSAALAAASLTLTACSTGPAGDDESSPASSSGESSPASSGSGSADSGGEGSGDGDEGAATFPVTVEHALGKTTIEEEPTRIATLGWSDHDIVAALGVKPVGAPEITWGGNANKSTDWFDKKANELDGEITRYSDADGAPIDEIATLQPDLILATNSGITPEEYEKLSKLAPVVAYPELAWGTSWQDSTKLIGQAMGKPAEAEQLVEDTEQKIADTAAKHPELEGTTAAWASFAATDLSTFTLYTTTDNRPRMLEDLGMVNAPVIGELSKDASNFMVEVSAEKADTVEADVVVFYADETLAADTVVKNDLLKAIPAFTRGSYVAADDPVASYPMSSPTPLSIPVALEEFVPQLAEAATKAQGAQASGGSASGEPSSE
ncbi:iron-siderophore ABC transporter substrate-binding protein [Kytococcus sedentarius]|uniref:iron-siderophore ABC transporter substrate-binding protein n=1 Tax=Kytococcus sedentarius TaxID=1276 RepID=UPI00194EB037|nr:iron-siderophore ABC transporter substrate-binding protein [Kytococcus sedentarius]QRO86966.1 iron-siderophore ABC transporter substrate-binding protein [Kytococcus sedentarius]